MPLFGGLVLWDFRVSAHKFKICRPCLRVTRVQALGWALPLLGIEQVVQNKGWLIVGCYGFKPLIAWLVDYAIPK